MRKVAEILADPATHCSSVLTILVDSFGTEVLGWEPESVRMEMADALGVNSPPLLTDKVNASFGLLTNDLYHKSLEAFTAINAALNRRAVSTTEFNMNTLDEILWGVTEARFLEGPATFDKAGFSHDIARYVGAMLSAEGIAKPPAVLGFAEYDEGEVDRRDLLLGSDAVLAEGYWRRQEDERGDLETRAASQFQGLLREVAGLPLRNGKPVLPQMPA